MAYAHRVAWELARGPVPAGLWLDHLCGVTSCCNPEHLEPVTAAENNRRSSLAKLSAPTVRAIRKMVQNGSTHVAIAKHFGVAKSTISMVAAGRTWSDVPPC